MEYRKKDVEILTRKSFHGHIMGYVENRQDKQSETIIIIIIRAKANFSVC
jgi:hypothetical protein